jgi:rRNA maturation protein Rpf1
VTFPLPQFESVAQRLSMSRTSKVSAHSSACGDSRLLRIAEADGEGLRLGFSSYPSAKLVLTLSHTLKTFDVRPLRRQSSTHAAPYSQKNLAA